MDYPVTCPHCGAEFDSQNSYADSKNMLRTHITRLHLQNAED